MGQVSLVPELTVTTMVHGGQALATNAEGKKVFVWNALPGEIVEARIIKRKRSYDEAIAERIIQASPERVDPAETNYLATSPWQMMSYEAENRYKQRIALDVMAHEKVQLPAVGPTIAPQQQWQYRNKMEYSFWGDDDGLHLALYQRGSHGKQIVTGSKLAMPSIDAAAEEIRSQLQALGIRAGSLKTLVLRSSQQGTTAAALFVKNTSFPELKLTSALQGLRVYYSNPKSPASVMTEQLQELGDVQLQDSLCGNTYTYDVDSFFQVNVPAFEQSLGTIAKYMQAPQLVDMYAGVGGIGLSVAQSAVTLVELDIRTAQMAAVNAAASQLTVEVVETSAEASLEYIAHDTPLVVDPPRAGLHPKLVAQIVAEQPPKIAYLSCNPATQARDVALLQANYKVVHFEVHNFFPRTPHIESLAILERLS